jgi:hypothetical protein
VRGADECPHSTHCGHWPTVQNRPMSGLILPLSWLIYIVLPAWMLIRGWPIRAALVMFVAALLPWAVWLVTMPKPWGAGAGFFVMITAVQLLLAVVPLVFGVVGASRRLLRRRSPAA